MTNNKIRQIVFKTIAVLLPLVVIVLLEFFLRLFHYGYNTHLFIEDAGRPGIINVNTRISKIFFSNNQDARVGIPKSFKKIKTSDTFRIFVIGESTAYGFPYTPRASFPRMLEARLSSTFREKNIEVINLSVTAINSIAFLSLADEITDMEPDAVLIYAGHNEYYGAMGAASSIRFISDRHLINLFIRFRKLKLSQLLSDITDSVKSFFTGKTIRNDEGFMHRMAGKQKIVYGSDLYWQGIEQFHSNMDELISGFTKHKIPIFFSNLVSNLRGQKPFISVLKNETDTAAFFTEFRKGEIALRKGETEESIKSFSSANLIDSSYAMCNFLEGESFYLRGEYSRAGFYFSNAKELDVLRFRAPEAINNEIIHLCSKYSNIHFVDTRKKFIDYSIEGILDNKLFLDHLHPDMYGNFLLADSFYNSIIESGIITGHSSFIPFDDAQKDLPVTAVDSVYGVWMNAIMKEQWPFYEHVSLNPDSISSYPEKLALQIFKNRISMDMAIDSLFSYYVKKKNLSKALKAAKSLSLDHPNVDNARKIVFCLLQLDKPEEVRYYLQYLIRLQPDDRMTIFLLKQTEEVLSLKKQFLDNPENENAFFALANYYLSIQNSAELKIYIDKAVAKYPHDTRTSRLLTDYNKLKSVGAAYR